MCVAERKLFHHSCVRAQCASPESCNSVPLWACDVISHQGNPKPPPRSGRVYSLNALFSANFFKSAAPATRVLMRLATNAIRLLARAHTVSRTDCLFVLAARVCACQPGPGLCGKKGRGKLPRRTGQVEREGKCAQRKWEAPEPIFKMSLCSHCCRLMPFVIRKKCFVCHWCPRFLTSNGAKLLYWLQLSYLRKGSKENCGSNIKENTLFAIRREELFFADFSLLTKNKITNYRNLAI